MIENFMKRFLLIGFILTVNLYAECFVTGSLTNFIGTVDNKYPIKMTLTKENNKIKGEYFYISKLKDINITADVDPNGDFTINEYDKNNNIMAQFIGKWEERHFKSGYCEKATGIWKNNKGKKFSFYLQLSEKHLGTLEGRYGWANIGDDKEFEKTVYAFWKGVKEDDKREVAKHIHYPLYKYDFAQKKFLSVDNEKEFVENYDKIITKKAKKDIVKSVPKYLFTTDEGVMLGLGYVWFDYLSKIVVINSSGWNRKKLIPN